MKDLFPTKQDKETAVSNFKALINHAGWKQLEMILDYNIDVVRKQLEDGVEGETKEDIELRRAKLKYQQELKDKPREMIKSFESVIPVLPEYDPYSTEEEIKKERRLDIKK